MQPLDTAQLQTVLQLTEEQLDSLTARIRSIRRTTCVALAVLGAILFLLMIGSVIPPLHVAPTIPIIVLAIPLIACLYVAAKVGLSMRRARDLLAVITTALLLRRSGEDIATFDPKL